MTKTASRRSYLVSALFQRQALAPAVFLAAAANPAPGLAALDETSVASGHLALVMRTKPLAGGVRGCFGDQCRPVCAL